MNFLNEDEFDEDEDFDALSFRSKRRNLRVLKQVGSSDKIRDESRKALMPGKRVSASGKVYWETRANRTDKKNSSI